MHFSLTLTLCDAPALLLASCLFVGGFSMQIQSSPAQLFSGRKENTGSYLCIDVFLKCMLDHHCQ